MGQTDTQTDIATIRLNWPWGRFSETILYMHCDWGLPSNSRITVNHNKWKNKKVAIIWSHFRYWIMVNEREICFWSKTEILIGVSFFVCLIYYTCLKNQFIDQLRALVKVLAFFLQVFLIFLPF